MKAQVAISFLLIVLMQSGCVTGRRTVPLSVPATAANASSRGDVCVVEVKDNRQFQNKPSDPSIPSVDGDVTALSSEQRATMIGRQRNGFGMATGDISLPAGQSVSERTKVLVEEALKRRGYVITSNPSAQSTATVSIDELWAWFSPGMWSIGFEARVYCTITLKRADSAATIVVHGYGENRGQVAKNANWQLAYERAFEDFLSKFESEIGRTDF